MSHIDARMARLDNPVSLADLTAAGIRLRPYEAVSIVRELVLQVARGEVAGIPSSHVIRLSSDGTVSVEGPVAAGGRSIDRAAELLDSLLPVNEPGNELPGEHLRVPGGLRLVVGRALGSLDLPPFESLDLFADALARFAASDSAETVAHLVLTWTEIMAAQAPAPDQVEAVEPLPLAPVERFVATRPAELASHGQPLTVSDIRRARRATGIPLVQVSKRSRIPLGLLRQLEWGYLANWPTGEHGRIRLIRYARAAGLDQQLVVATISPLIDEAEARRTALVIQSLAPPVPVEEPIIEIEVLPHRTAVGSGAWPRFRARALAALAIPALLAIGLLPVWWGQRSSEPTIGDTMQQSAESRGTSGAPSSPADDAAPTEPLPAAVPSTLPATPAPSSVPVRDVASDRARAAADSEDVEGTAGAERFTLDAIASSPAFASAGTAAFYQTDKDGRTVLARADTDNRDSVLRVTRIVDDGAKTFNAQPSPDGSRIAFDSDRDGVLGVYVADANGNNVRRVSPEGFAAVPSWSPDGRTLAFVRADASRPRVWNLFTLDMETGELRQITQHDIGQPWGASWFADGGRLAYGYEDQLVIKDLRSGEERVIRSPRRGRQVRRPAVSPDGRRIMFQVQGDGAWLLEVSDGSMRRVLEDPTAAEYTWSPDGTRVAYYSRRSGGWGVWVMAPR